MRRFYGFITKEVFHILRDSRTLAILFGIPVVQMLLFGFAITNEIKDARIAVLDLSNDQITQKLTNKIISTGYFKLDRYLSSTKDIEATFREGNVKMVIVYEPDFGQKFIRNNKASAQLIADASEPNTANLLVNYTQGIIQDFVRLENAANGHSPGITTEVRMAYNPGLKGVFMFVPGIMAMLLILISALMTSISITREKEMGTMEVLLVSPLRPVQIILGKVTPYVLLSFLNASMILLVAKFVFGVPILGSLALLMLECTLYIMVALTLGILISTLVKTQQLAMMISLVGLMLPTILLSGFIYPIENMPVPLQALCQVMPPRWFISILKEIMLKGNGFQYIWKETLVLVMMSFIFIGLSVKKFKIRLD
ncbi:MAG: ABC transporter permease [Bacteroidota bacterium]